MRKFLFNVSLIALPLFLVVGPVYALEIVISENGSGSENQAVTNIESETVVEQTNEANINNDIQVEANTGENQANSNTTEDTSINTGDANLQTQVTNDLNYSQVETGCCAGGETNLIISGNGTDSQNNVKLTTNQPTNIIVNQQANIENNVNILANTGYNQANSNNGDVKIETGNINGNLEIKNGGNLSNLKIFHDANQDISIAIKNNGENSINNIHYNFNNDIFINRTHIFNSLNNVNLWANTGFNFAKGNLGDVSISTGDIIFGIKLINSPVNIGGIVIDCCDNPFDPSDPSDPEDPSNPIFPPPSGGNSSSDSGGNSGSSSSSSNGSSDDKDGDVLGAILPATGADWMLIALLANIIMFLMGVYLRLRSGRSPDFNLS